MAKIKVTKNLYRGRRIWFMFGIIWQSACQNAIAYDLGDGRWIVRPADFFLRWGYDSVEEKLGRFYTVKK